MSDRYMGKYFIFGFPGYTCTEETNDFIAEYRPAGFIFFKDNLDTIPQITKLLLEIRNTYHNLDLPTPWLAIDHEGGAVHRLPAPITHFPPAETWDTLAPDAVFHIGEQMGAQLHDLGFTANFAPVCDIASDVTAPYLRPRIISADANRVAHISAAWIGGLQSQNIFACGKHFPGLGTASADPHFTQIACPDSLETFRTHHWVPFRSAIAAHVQSIMTSHVECPSLDPIHMTTYSAKTIEGYLKGELGFTGTIISDDICMGAISHPRAEAAWLALHAGHDLIICSERSCTQNAELIDKLHARYRALS